MTWKFHDKMFVMDQAPELPQKFVKYGSWSGHRHFAYDLVRFAKPRTIVELGTFYGTSFFSFCQAVNDGQIHSRCYAVDTWKGDPHVGYYGEDVYQAVNEVTTREFPQIGSQIRSDFNQALSLFEDSSIDLLHIDGYHTYEATLHDYTTWYPKLAEGAIVLFHDIAVHIEDFGVYRLWEQLIDLPHFEFPHSNGLGVLFPKGVPVPFQDVIEQKDAIIETYLNKSTE